MAVALSVLGGFAAHSSYAQTSIQEGATPLGEPVEGIKIVERHPLPPKSPFPILRLDDTSQGYGQAPQSLEFRSPSQMSAEDARMAENAQTAIAERATHQGYDVWNNVGDGPDQWNYEQAVCPVFPDQLILEYSRNLGKGDVSLFSVMIPRGNEGHVRVIPVRRRSYSLWTSSPSNELTLNDFNHLVKENPNGLDPDWLTIGLCYAAMVGGHVRAALQAMTPAQEVYPLFVPAKLTSFSTTGAEIRFADTTHFESPRARDMVWVMNFAQSGRLLKVRREVAGKVVERPLPAALPNKSWHVEGSVDLSKPVSSLPPSPGPGLPGPTQ